MKPDHAKIAVAAAAVDAASAATVAAAAGIAAAVMVAIVVVAAVDVALSHDGSQQFKEANRIDGTSVNPVNPEITSPSTCPRAHTQEGIDHG